MPITKEITLYKFDELSDDAKEKARDWWRNLESQDHDYDHVYDEAERLGKLIGIEIDPRGYDTVGGDRRYAPKIYWTGFSSQGDGACFEGSYAYAKGAVKALKKEIGGESEGDKELIRIAEALQAIQKRYFYKIIARMRHRGHYYHSGCMAVEVGVEDLDRYCDHEDDIIQLMRDFADWIYRQLRSEYEWTMSDEVVDENICANEYTFTEDGKRED